MKLIARDLSTIRGGRAIYEKLSFSLSAGEALLLTGPNGAGKTTLIRSIAGFLPLAKGELRLEGGDRDLALGEQCHYVGHRNAVKAKLTVAENLEFWARFLGGAAGSSGGDGTTPTLVEAVLERFGLSSLRDIPAGYLSAGQSRRLGLARLLVAARPLWLLDEPTVSLDKDSTQILAAAVNEHVAGGGLVIAATHLPLGLATARELQLGRAQVAA